MDLLNSSILVLLSLHPIPDCGMVRTGFWRILLILWYFEGVRVRDSGRNDSKLPENECFQISITDNIWNTSKRLFRKHISGHDFGNFSSKNHHGLDSRFVSGCRRFIPPEKLMPVFLSSNEVPPDRFCREIPCNGLQNASFPSPKSPIGNYLNER